MHTTKFFSISILFFRYALCVNKTNGTTALHKISKGKRLAETPVLTTFNYEIRSAAMTVASNSNPGDKSVVLVAYDAIGDVARVYSIQKTEGFRGRHPLCSATTGLLTNTISSICFLRKKSEARANQ